MSHSRNFLSHNNCNPPNLAPHLLSSNILFAMRVVSRAALSYLRAAANSDLQVLRGIPSRAFHQRSTPLHRTTAQQPLWCRHSSTSPPQREDTRPGARTHYDFFPTAVPSGAPPNGPFEIDLRALRKEFLQLQAKAHPDLAPADKKRQAEALSARINEAYKTLQNPLLRAQYLLSERGIEVQEDAGAEAVGQDTLMEVLEVREEIEEATTDEEVLALREVNETRVRESEGIIATACKEGDWEAVRKESIKLRYWVNIREALENWEPGKPVVLQH